MIPTYLRIARQSLEANRVRTALTVLGILIGVAAIALVLSLGEGARNTVRSQVGKLDGNIIVVKPGQNGSRNLSAYNPYNTAITSTLTEQDYRTAATSPNVSVAAPLMFISGSVKYENVARSGTSIIATNEHLDDILQLTIKSGEFIDSSITRDTVVVGQQLALDLFGTDQAMGQSIIVKGRPHTVVGVVKNLRQSINITGVDLDRAVYTSLDNGKSFNQGIAQIQQLIVKDKSTEHIPALADTLHASILTNHKGEEDFTVLAGNDIVASTDELFKNVALITTIVAAISIIVGGIGIMNIMLASVSERTREIGIRKAVGATDGHIIGQFLIEALAMSFAGGVIGLIVAYGVGYLISMQLFFAPALTWQIVVGSLAIALITGVAFGLYPAIKAARKDPIDALRQYD